MNTTDHPAPTPRTDGFIASHHAQWPRWDWQDHASAYADFARILERELAAKDAEIARLMAEGNNRLPAFMRMTDWKARAERATARVTELERQLAEAEQFRAELGYRDQIIARLNAESITQNIDRANLRTRTEKAEARVTELERQLVEAGEDKAWEFESLKNNLLNANQQIEDANGVINLFFEACSETNVGMFHERLGNAFERFKSYRAAIDATRDRKEGV